MIAAARAVAHWFRPGVLCLVVLAASALVGCSSPPGASVSVTLASLFDQPVHIVVSGLNPGQAVTVGLRSADATGAVWTAQAVFRPDQSGTVDLATAPAASGSYRGIRVADRTVGRTADDHANGVLPARCDGQPGAAGLTVPMGYRPAVYGSGYGSGPDVFSRRSSSQAAGTKMGRRITDHSRKFTMTGFSGGDPG